MHEEHRRVCGTCVRQRSIKVTGCPAFRTYEGQELKQIGHLFVIMCWNWVSDNVGSTPDTLVCSKTATGWMYWWSSESCISVYYQSIFPFCTSCILFPFKHIGWAPWMIVCAQKELSCYPECSMISRHHRYPSQTPNTVVTQVHWALRWFLAAVNFWRWWKWNLQVEHMHTYSLASRPESRSTSLIAQCRMRSDHCPSQAR